MGKAAGVHPAQKPAQTHLLVWAKTSCTIKETDATLICEYLELQNLQFIYSNNTGFIC